MRSNLGWALGAAGLIVFLGCGGAAEPDDDADTQAATAEEALVDGSTEVFAPRAQTPVHPTHGVGINHWSPVPPVCIGCPDPLHDVAEHAGGPVK